MAIEIKKTDGDTYQVNGNTIYRNGSGEWVCKTELSVMEIRAFQQHINSAE